MRRNFWLKILTVAFYLTILVPFVQAQYRASLRGVVTDPQGAVVSGATLTLLNTDTNATMTAKTDAAGIYVFNALPTANYKITVEQTGFKKKVLERVLIIPDQLNALDLQIEVGQVQESVTVSDTTYTLDTETATTSATITTRDVATLPAFGRDVFKLAQLAPGVFGEGGNQDAPGARYRGQGTGSGADGLFKTENGPPAIAAGQAEQRNSVTMDGISTVSATWGGASIITPSPEAVQEVKVVTNAYDAENGRFTGAQIQVTSKSGSNQPHGSAFFTRHSPGLNAYQSWNGPDQPVNRDTNQFSQFGGSLGAPIWKNKIFGFFTWETVRTASQSNPDATVWLETPQLAGLAPSGSIAAQYLNFPGSMPSGATLREVTCADAGYVASNCRQIAGKGLDIGSPLSTPLGTHDPTGSNDSTAPGIGGGFDGIADIAEYTYNSKTGYTKNQYVGRVDANLTQKDRLSGSIYWVPQSSDFQNGNRGYDIFHHTQKNQAFSAIWNRTISSTFVNEARFNAASWRWNEVTSNPQMAVGLPQSYVPRLEGFGPNTGSIFKQWTYSYKDVATKVLGRHTVKFGGDLTRLYYYGNWQTGGPGYSFFNLWDFMNDAPKEEWGAFLPDGSFGLNAMNNRENLWGLFVQDDFRARRNLTINLGLRWSYFGPLSAKEGTMNRAVPGAGSAFLTGLKVVNAHSWDAEKGNFGPQIGFAWSPSAFKDKLVVRGGYGLTFNQEQIADSANIFQNPGTNVWHDASMALPSDPNPGIVYALSTDLHKQAYPINPNFTTTFNANGLPTSGGNIIIFPQTMPTMRVHHYSVDAQYEFLQKWTASLGYIGSVSHNVPFTSNPNAYAASKGYDLNPLVTGGTYFGANGRANYNGMNAELKHPFSHGLLFDVQFTWAKSMDTSSHSQMLGTYPDSPDLNYGPSDYDVKHAWKIFGSYTPTFFKGKPAWMEKTLGGWTITGIYNIHSGFPWTPLIPVEGGNLYCGQCGNGFYQYVRPATMSGAGTSTSNSSYKTGSNFQSNGTSNFTTPAYTAYSGTSYGNGNPVPGIGRNSLRGPGYRGLDATLLKSFGLPKAPILGESAKLEFRVDAFNLFNNLNLAGGNRAPDFSWSNMFIENRVGNPNFGKSMGAYPGRIVTLGARFEF